MPVCLNHVPPLPSFQVNGKVRGTVSLAVDAGQDAALAAALELPNVQKFTDGKEIKKVIFVAGKILNLIVK